MTAIIVSGGYLTLLMLLVLCGIYNLKWFWKATSIMLSLTCCFIFLEGFQSFLGWPKDGLPEGTIRYVSSVVQEPSNGVSGIIYLWYISKDDKRPRAIMIPYSEETAKMMRKAKKTDADGIPVYMNADGNLEGNSPNGLPNGSPNGLPNGTGNSPYSKAADGLKIVNPPDTSVKK